MKNIQRQEGFLKKAVVKRLSIDARDWNSVTERDFTVLQNVITCQKMCLQTVVLVMNVNLLSLNGSFLLSLFPALATCGNLKSITVKGEFPAVTPGGSDYISLQGFGSYWSLHGDKNIKENYREEVRQHVQFLSQFSPIEFLGLQELKIKIRPANFRLIDYLLLNLRAPRLKRLWLDVEHTGRSGIGKLIDFLLYHSQSRQLEHFTFYVDWHPVIIDEIYNPPLPWSPELLRKADEIGEWLTTLVYLDLHTIGIEVTLLEPIFNIFKRLAKNSRCLKSLTVDINECHSSLDIADDLMHQIVACASLRVLKVNQKECVFNMGVLNRNCPNVQEIFLKAVCIENLDLLPPTCKRLSLYGTELKPLQWDHLKTVIRYLEVLEIDQIGNEQDRLRLHSPFTCLSATLYKTIYQPTMKVFSVRPVVCRNSTEHLVTEDLLQSVPNIYCLHYPYFPAAA